MGLTHTQMNEWRLKATELFGEYFTIINPVDFYNFEIDRSTYTDLEVMDFDLIAVKNSDFVIVNFKTPDTIGTANELIMAYRVWGIPVIAFGGEWEKVHPWMRCCTTKYCKTLEEAVAYIKEFYLPILG